MKKEEIDKLISQSLSKDEAEFYKNLEGEEGLFKSMTGIYSGKLAWVTAVMAIVHLVVAVIAFYSGYQLFTAESADEMLYFGSIMFAGMIKLWTWLQMQKKSVLREVKRIEYQVAVLIEKISEKMTIDL